MTDINLSLDKLIMDCVVAVLRDKNVEPYAGLEPVDIIDLDSLVVDREKLPQSIKQFVLAEITALVGQTEKYVEGMTQNDLNYMNRRNQLRTEILNKAKQRFGKDN